MAPARRELGEDYELVAPEHYGCESTGPWTGDHAFTLADEAARSVALIDGTDRKIHLIGHSYGGGVALHVALARPERIASLRSTSPPHSICSAVRSPGPRPSPKSRRRLRGACGIVIGDYRGAAATFVDYWSGRGAWDALRPAVQDA